MKPQQIEHWTSLKRRSQWLLCRLQGQFKKRSRLSWQRAGDYSQDLEQQNQHRGKPIGNVVHGFREKERSQTHLTRFWGLQRPFGLSNLWTLRTHLQPLVNNWLIRLLTGMWNDTQRENRRSPLIQRVESSWANSSWFVCRSVLLLGNFSIFFRVWSAEMKMFGISVAGIGRTRDHSTIPDLLFIRIHCMQGRRQFLPSTFLKKFHFHQASLMSGLSGASKVAIRHQTGEKSTVSLGSVWSCLLQRNLLINIHLLRQKVTQIALAFLKRCNVITGFCWSFMNQPFRYGSVIGTLKNVCCMLLCWERFQLGANSNQH